MKNKNKKKINKKKDELSAGWLSPSGEYFKLEGYHLCHEGLAQEILGGYEYLEESELAMNVLLKRKWALIRNKDFYCPKKTYFAGWGLTVEQKHFLKPYIEDGEIVEADIY